MSGQLQLYDYTYSGHAHRIRNFLSIIGKEYEKVNVNMREGEHKAVVWKLLNRKPLSASRSIEKT